jgi:hypothetical protein
MYNWVLYGIMSFLAKIREHVQEHINQSAPVSPYVIELVSALERAYNFGHTGSSKALSRQLMNNLWISLGITNDGFPCLHPGLKDLTDPSLSSLIPMTTALERIWGSHPNTNKPLFASQRAQVLTYDQNHWNVR